MSGPVPQEDNPSISDEDRLVRRVRPHQLVREGASVRPSSAVFKSEELSIYIESLLVEQGRALGSTLEKYPTEFLTSVRAGEVRKFEHAIVKDTAPPNDPAHGLVLGKKKERFANAMVRCQEWIVPRND